MSRVAVANHAKLSWLLFRGAMRRLAGRANGHPLLRWPLTSAQGRPAADRAAGFAHRRRHARERNLFRPFRFRRQGRGLRWPLHFRNGAAVGGLGDGAVGFGWLRHLRAAESGITRANARALVDEWIALQGSWHPIAWRPDVLSRRIISWLSQSTLILQDADVRFYRRFLRSLVRQVRYLRHTAGDAQRGVARMQADIALELCRAVHCRPGAAHQVRDRAAAARDRRQILPDGGHISRDPGAIIEILLELLPLRQAFTARNIAPPQALLECHRPHDADAALLPSFRGDLRAFQRHGGDAGGSAL